MNGLIAYYFMSQKCVNKALFTVADATAVGIALYYMYARLSTPQRVMVARTTFHEPPHKAFSCSRFCWLVGLFGIRWLVGVVGMRYLASSTHLLNENSRTFRWMQYASVSLSFIRSQLVRDAVEFE